MDCFTTTSWNRSISVYFAHRSPAARVEGRGEGAGNRASRLSCALVLGLFGLKEPNTESTFCGAWSIRNVLFIYASRQNVKLYLHVMSECWCYDVGLFFQEISIPPFSPTAAESSFVWVSCFSFSSLAVLPVNSCHPSLTIFRFRLRLLFLAGD